MEIKTATSFVGFLVALATVNLPATAAAELRQSESPVSPKTAAVSPSPVTSHIDNRLARLTAALREREAQLPVSPDSPEDGRIAGWANGRGGTWVNTRRGGWGNGRDGGGFVNVNPWRNGWGDRGGFFNHNPWRNGGGGWLDRGW